MDDLLNETDKSIRARLDPKDQEAFMWFEPPQQAHNGSWYVTIAMDWADEGPYNITKYADSPELAIERAIADIPRHSYAISAGRDAYERALAAWPNVP